MPRAILGTLLLGCGAPVGLHPPAAPTTTPAPSITVPAPPAPSPAADARCANLRYHVVDLGTALVSTIDPAGRVVGATCPTLNAPCHAAVYTPGSGWASVPEPAGAGSSTVVGIDARGEFAMEVSFVIPGRPGPPSYQRAFTAPPLRPFPTGALDPPYPQTNLVNAVHPTTGHMVGYDEALGGAFLYDGLTVTPIAVRPGSTFIGGGPSQATAINARDEVVGWMRAGSSPDPYNVAPAHAFLWDGAEVHDLGALGRCYSEALGINDGGVVMGMVDVGDRCGVPQVFVWDGQMHILGCPAGAAVCWPYAMDARGDIVGNALRDVLTPERAFIHCGGVFAFLDTLLEAPEGWSLEYAVGINDVGQIAGWGHLNGTPRAFMLCPVSE